MTNPVQSGDLGSSADADTHRVAETPAVAHGPKCWGRTSYSEEVAHCYCDFDAREKLAREEALQEAVTRAILFEDCGSDADWTDNLNLGRVAVAAYRQATGETQ